MLQPMGHKMHLINEFFKARPKLKNTDSNVTAFFSWLNDKENGCLVGNEIVISTYDLQRCLDALAREGKIEFHENDQTRAQLEQAQADRLALQELQDSIDRKAAADATEQTRQDDILRKRLERQAKQDASGPGRTSAMEGAEESRKKEQQESAKRARDAAQRVRHAQFDGLVREARQEASAEVHSRKEGKFAALYAKIKQRFPESEFTAKFRD